MCTFWRVRMLISDAQVHLWEADRPDRPWPKGQQRPPHRPNGFGAEEMLAEMDAAGVDRAVIVPPTWVGENNLMACEAAARYPARFAVVGRFDVKASDARTQLEAWMKQPQMLGVRMSFHVKPFVDWLEDGSLDWFWTSCERLGIPVMALVPGMVHKLLPIAERHGSLKILIPHMGCTLDVRAPTRSRGSGISWLLRTIPGSLSWHPLHHAFPMNDIPFVTFTFSFGGSMTRTVRDECFGARTAAA